MSFFLGMVLSHIFVKYILKKGRTSRVQPILQGRIAFVVFIYAGTIKWFTGVLHRFEPDAGGDSERQGPPFTQFPGMHLRMIQLLIFRVPIW